MADLSSADIGEIAAKHAEYAERMQVRFATNFAGKEELERQIEECTADYAKHQEEYEALIEEIKAEKAKLPPLRAKVNEAERVVDAQRSVIGLLENRATRARRLACIAAQDRAGYEVQMENKDYNRFKSAQG